ncbi:hypothetical protein JYT25_00620 [bacterium AH-315-C20]|nr:hypothetical protein [bacterium AH-315-C20]
MHEIYFLETEEFFSNRKTLKFLLDQINVSSTLGTFDEIDIFSSMEVEDELQEYFYSAQQRILIDIRHSPQHYFKFKYQGLAKDFSFIFEKDQDFSNGHISLSSDEENAMMERVKKWIEEKNYQGEESDHKEAVPVVSDSKKRGLNNQEIVDRLMSGKWYLNNLGSMRTSLFYMRYVRETFYYFSLTNRSGILYELNEVRPNEMEAFLTKTQGPVGYIEDFFSPIEDLDPVAEKLGEYLDRSLEIMSFLKKNSDHCFTIMKDWHLFYKPHLEWYSIVDSEDYDVGYYETVFSAHRVQKEVINSLIGDEKASTEIGARSKSDHRQKEINEILSGLFPAGISSDRLYFKDQYQAFAVVGEKLALYFQFEKSKSDKEDAMAELDFIFKTTNKEHRGVILEMMVEGIKALTSVEINKLPALDAEVQKLGFPSASKEILQELFTVKRIQELIKQNKIYIDCSWNRIGNYRSVNFELLRATNRSKREDSLPGILGEILEDDGFVKIKILKES